MHEAEDNPDYRLPDKIMRRNPRHAAEGMTPRPQPHPLDHGALLRFALHWNQTAVTRMPEHRKQLSMYVPEDAAREIEAVRKVVDPIQSSLIPAHITLCREDELGDLASVRARLRSVPFQPLTLRFGKPVAFSGHGLLLECMEGEDQFRALREYLLASSRIKNQKPHMTLAHPRNPRSSGNSSSNASTLPEVIEVTLPSIYLIEQEGNEPWQVLETYELRGLQRTGG